ncbi:hypothetical protein J2045_003819 [Peteryoungia aggregata LMG 23059]|uniref:Uncharacterized protein n=1 Tax=Peteryoungia aggregata LMG 23059 TaxID=1368425 RepID=A0ABU0GCU7_9HYPH|nr:hypothetical protein [Peteryoungia aggregata]MDQ0422769.1 hypothetical protein [Peteryoungia aggregata LMG 23059]
MSQAIARLFGDHRSRQSLEICRQRLAMIAAATSIGFIAVLLFVL